MGSTELDTVAMLDLLKRAEQRGVWPPAATRIRALEVMEGTSRELARAIAMDPLLSARMLSSANQGDGQRVESIEQAIESMGFDRACELAVGFGIVQLGDIHGPRRTGLWRHALVVGSASQLLSRYARQLDGHVAFMSGLLHDLGKQLFLELDEELYGGLLDRFGGRPLALCAAERIAFEMDHPALGAAALRRWSLPDSICSVVRHHHTPAELVPAGVARGVKVLELAQALTREYDLGTRDHALEKRLVTHPSRKALEIPSSAVSVIVGVFQEDAARTT